MLLWLDSQKISSYFNSSHKSFWETSQVFVQKIKNSSSSPQPPNPNLLEASSSHHNCYCHRSEGWLLYHPKIQKSEQEHTQRALHRDYSSHDSFLSNWPQVAYQGTVSDIHNSSRPEAPKAVESFWFMSFTNTCHHHCMLGSSSWTSMSDTHPRYYMLSIAFLLSMNWCHLLSLAILSYMNPNTVLQCVQWGEFFL